MRFIFVYFLLTILFISCAPKADIILFNGKVITVDSNFSIAQAIAIKDGKILATGSDEQILHFAGDNTEKINLANKTVIPGLIDEHVHPVTASQSELIDTIPDVHTIGDLLTYIRQQSTVKKPGEWIIHPKFFITRMLDRRQLTLKELDDAAPNNPVFLNGSFGGMINTKAMLLSHLDTSTHTGMLHDAKTGKATGFIHSSIFPLLAIPAGSPLTEQQMEDALKRMFTNYNKMAITSICSGGGDSSEYALYENLHDKNALTVRIFHNFLYSFHSPVNIDTVNHALDILHKKTGDGDEMLKVGALKVVLDGGVLTGTAYLREPWGIKSKDIYGITDPHYRGNIFYTKQDLLQLINIALKRGWKFTAHVTGGGGVDTLIAAYEHINDSAKLNDKRFSIIHGNFFTEEAINKMAAMNIYADMQPAWYVKDADLLNEVLGTDRIGTFHPYRSMIGKGIVINGGSDHMVKLDPNTSINPYNPFLAMWSLVTRKTERGTVFNAEQAISREEALKLYTINNAKASFEEKLKGSLEKGKVADLAIISSDILTCAADSIKNIRATLTMLNGKIVYKE